MKRALIGLLFGCLTMGIASISFAGDNQQAAIAVHVGPSVTKLPCQNQPVLTSATMSTQACGAGEYNAWLLVCNGSDSTGVAGAEFGIQYDGLSGSGIDVNQWSLCGDLEFPQANWPSSGEGTIITFEPSTNCQNTNSEPFVPKTVIAILGVLNVSVYSPDALSIIPRTTQFDTKAKVADCDSAEDDLTLLAPSHLGIAEFCAGPGYNPCGLPTPVEPTTWGAIKGAYNN